MSFCPQESPLSFSPKSSITTGLVFGGTPKELSEATADEAIMSVIERKRRLSQIARVRYDDPDRAGDPLTAIHQLNLMDGVYRNKGEVAAPGGSSTVVVVENARTKLAAIINKLSVGVAEAEDVPPLEEGKQEGPSSKTSP